MKLFIYFTDTIASYERLWIFSDDFGSRSFEKYFKTKTDGYARSHFDVTGFSNSKISDNPSVIGRLANLMRNATITPTAGRKTLPFPKLTVVVPDDDIISCLPDTCEQGFIKAFNRMVNHVMTEHERAVAAFKECIPAKAKKDGYPHILWILAPMHNNFNNNSKRYKFNKGVEDSAKFHSNVTCLHLKKVWDPVADDLFSKEYNRYTTEGYKKYWGAVDRTIRYCDSIFLKKREKFAKRQVNTLTGDEEKSVDANKYRWFNPNIKNDVKRFKEQKQKKLPAPPSVGH